MLLPLLALLSGCTFQITSAPLCSGEEVGLESTWWEGSLGGDTAEPTEPEGFEGVVYTTREEWDARLSGATDPIPSVDFDSHDVLLYRHYYGGCGAEVEFPGACLEGGERVVMAEWSDQRDCCDAWIPGWFVLVIGQANEEPVRTVPPDPNDPHC